MLQDTVLSDINSGESENQTEFSVLTERLCSDGCLLRGYSAPNSF